MAKPNETFAAARAWLKSVGVDLTARSNYSIVCGLKNEPHTIRFRCPARLDVDAAIKAVESALRLSPKKRQVHGDSIELQLDKKGTRSLKVERLYGGTYIRLHDKTMFSPSSRVARRAKTSR